MGLFANQKAAILLAASLCFSATASWAAQLNYGRYVGTLQIDGHQEVLAVSLDAFVTQLNDPSTYPEMDVIVRVNLGGYFSSEYVGYEFYDPTYNFENGVLELNDPKDDFTATLQITNTDSQIILEGPVMLRMTGAKGTLHVAMDTDDEFLHPFRQMMNASAPAPFLPVLRGNYLGICGNDAADLQIETGRGLGADAPGTALVGYTITGRLGFSQIPGVNPEPGDPKYRSLYPYSSGVYSPYTNQLTLQGRRSMLNCTRTGDTLQCVSQGYDKTTNCTLTKTAEPATPAVQYPAGIFLDVPVNAKQPLPVPSPPGNDDLIKALNGNFYGFLHYENRDIYQLIEMDAVATTSTENPHILNQVLVEPSFLLRVGSSWNSVPARSLLFPQRVFYLNPGFAFQADREDLFAVIGEWRMGYVNGVMYSRSYGRVGTFELIKGVQPEIPSAMTTVLDPTGAYQGPNDPSSPIQNLWSISVQVPNQTSGLGQVGVPLIGQYGCIGNRGTFGAASLDLNTGTLQFLINDELGNRIVTGQAATANTLDLLWPAGPNFGAPMDVYQSLPFTSVSEGK